MEQVEKQEAGRDEAERDKRPDKFEQSGPSSGLTLRRACGCPRSVVAVVHGLDADTPGTGKAIEDEIACATHYSGTKSENLWVHSHGLVAVDPAPWLDVDLLTRCEVFLEDVAVTMQPHHPFGVGRGEPVHE